jgi:hypothetical protein
VKDLIDVPFPPDGQIDLCYQGRNGIGQCRGIQVWHGDPTRRVVWVSPVNSKGPTNKCLIQIPFNQTLDVARALSNVLDKVLDAIPDRLPILLGLDPALDRILEQKIKRR